MQHTEEATPLTRTPPTIGVKPTEVERDGIVRVEKKLVLIHNEISFTSKDRQMNRLLRYRLIQKLFECGCENGDKYNFGYFNDAMRSRGAMHHSEIYNSSKMLQRSKSGYSDPLEDIAAVVWIPNRNDLRDFFKVLAPRSKGYPGYHGLKIAVCDGFSEKTICSITEYADVCLYREKKSNGDEPWRIVNNSQPHHVTLGKEAKFSRAVYLTLDKVLH